MHLPGPRSSPVYIPKPPRALPKVEKDKKVFFLNKGAFKKYTIYRACSLQKTPSGEGPHPRRKKKREKNKKKRKKVKK